MIIQLTGPSDEEVFINSDHVVRFSKLGEYTALLLIGDQWFSVKESPYHIMEVVNSFHK